MSKRSSKSSSLTKSQLCSSIADKTGLKKSEVEEVFSTLFDIVKQELSRECPVTIPGLVKIRIHHKKATSARKGRNPTTGEEITIKAKPARKVVKVRVVKSLKELAPR